MAGENEGRRHSVVANTVTELLVLPARYFMSTIGAVSKDGTVIFSPVASRSVLSKPPEKRTSDEIDAATLYCSSRLHFFAQLSQHSARALVSRIGHQIVPPRTPIIREGSYGTNIYVLLEGEAAVHIKGKPVTRLQRPCSSKREVLKVYGEAIASFTAGDSFG